MLILTDQITDWRDLQNKVAELFNEMGYLPTTPKLVDLAGRGQKEVDVYVEDPRASVNQVMLIECKLWNASVSQDTVHSMHTVMAGSGANTGFIVSKAGFQKGAYKAAKNTNIHLFTWEELQHKFGRQWFLYRRDALKLLVSELNGIYGAYLNQMNPLMAISNTMQFEATGFLHDLYDVLLLIRIAILAEMGGPKAYDDPGPFNIGAEEGVSGAIRDKYGLWGISVASAREYFDWVGAFAHSQLERFRALQKSAREKFDALPDEDGNAAFEGVLRQITEETPVRVFREYLGAELYEQLIAKHQTKATR